MQEDYAYFAEALITLYDITGEKYCLDRAVTLTNIMLEKFWDEQHGGFMMGEGNSLFVQSKEATDSAIPSCNSVAMHILVKLAQRTLDPRYQKLPNKTVQAFATTINQSPSAFAYILAGLDKHLHGLIGPVDYAAHGAIKVITQHKGQGNKRLIQLTLNVAPSWHISENPIRLLKSGGKISF
ncbi:MAG: hypothetical protein GY774_19670 [Planctomycetes bacterium]|nr:hypothetical protein [Planctomycetota bacterium]